VLLSHNELVQLVKDGVIEGVQPGAINAASIDIHLGRTILFEPESPGTVIDYTKRETLDWNRSVGDGHWDMYPGDFLLAQSVEVFHLPNNISAEYKLKSSMARIGLEHMNAGWCDAGWNGSVLTLELKNMLRWHTIRIRPGDAIGQMIFFRHEPVGDEASYATRGRYNNDTSVSGIKV
jgi:dCTP deaminase